jgi:hypothetical protein
MVSNCFEITLQKELQGVDEAVTLLQAQIHELKSIIQIYRLKLLILALSHFLHIRR